MSSNILVSCLIFSILIGSAYARDPAFTEIELENGERFSNREWNRMEPRERIDRIERAERERQKRIERERRKRQRLKKGQKLKLKRKQRRQYLPIWQNHLSRQRLSGSH